ncbi:MAG: hypothetical protein Q4E55_02120 [Bacteroidales bacterium]|nr:hypothetical protein [Bacteroidales bacterium]
MKKFVLGCSLVVFPMFVSAGGLLTNTNQSAAFLGQFARGTTLDCDAVYYNPAGTVFMTDGYHLGLNWQQSIQRRINDSTFGYFSDNKDGGGTSHRRFVGKTYAPFVPSYHLVYKRNRLSLMSSFAFGGGGGSVEYGDGLSSFESTIISSLAHQNMSKVPYSLDMYLKATSIIGAFQLGAAYRLSDCLSVATQLRFTYGTYHFEGHLNDVNIYLNDAKPHSVMENMSLDARQKGFCVSPIFALAFQKDGWSGSMKYEVKQALKVRNSTKETIMGLFPDGAHEYAELPALLTVAASKKIDWFKAVIEYHHFYDHHADNSFTGVVSHGENEYLAGFEFDATNRLLLTTSFQRSLFELDDNRYSDMNYCCNCSSVGIGASYRLSSKLKLSAGCMYSFYDTVEKTSTILTTNDLYDEFTRKNLTYGIGMQIDF